MTSYAEVKTSIASLFLLSTLSCPQSHIVNPVLEHSTLLVPASPIVAGSVIKLVTAL